MLETLKTLCTMDGTSGHEDKIREYIIAHLPADCEHRTDALGNLIVFKKGKQEAKNKVMLAAHMDEVGVIVTHIDEKGYLKFTTVGGITPAVLAGRCVRFANGTVGVLGIKPIHLTEKSDECNLPDTDKMYIDIGADTREEAEAKVALGDVAVFNEEFITLGENKVCSKALDDRMGCLALLTLLNEEIAADAYFVFTVQEEIGLRGAGTAAFQVAPDFCIVLEGTTAADLPDADGVKKVCIQGNGAAVSFMDRSTLYPPKLYKRAWELAKENNIPVQTKTMVAGGNDAGAIHKAGAGVQVLTVNVPCRYIHSGSSVADLRDYDSLLQLVRLLIGEIAGV
ncbi:MAG: M42 family metallopeptidase [Clostridia bacterium]|nr:M42 family metallopeptidase [Clostridia bacterium]